VLLLSMAASALSGLSMPVLFLLFGTHASKLFTISSLCFSQASNSPLTLLDVGKLTEEFTGFFRQGADETEAVFTSTVNKYV
jgi:hypothetical protein